MVMFEREKIAATVRSAGSCARYAGILQERRRECLDRKISRPRRLRVGNKRSLVLGSDEVAV